MGLQPDSGHVPPLIVRVPVDLDQGVGDVVHQILVGLVVHVAFPVDVYYESQAVPLSPQYSSLILSMG